MTDILLAHGYFLWEDEKEQQIMKPYPTLGLLYISSYLRRAGFGVEIFDTTFSSRPALLARLDQGRGVLGLYTNLITRATIVWIMGEAKKRGWTVVVGGPESANYPEQYLAHGADVVVVGEGEATMAELLPALAQRGPHRLHGVHGTVFATSLAWCSITLSASRSPTSTACPGPTASRSTSRSMWRHGASTTAWAAST